jgi:ATP-dependent DNA helicase RecG
MVHESRQPEQLSLFDGPNVFEATDLEFKAAQGGLPGSMWETYSAFANSGGGQIVLGIEELSRGRLRIPGIADPDKMISEIRSTANNKGKVSANLLGEHDVTRQTMGDKEVIIVRVPRATRYQRPVYLDNDPLRKSFRRDHSGDYRCTEDEVRRMFADQSNEPADSRVLDNFTLQDLDQGTLQRFRNRMSASNPNHPWLLEDDLELLKKLGGWRKERSTNIEGVTAAGLLMFGRMEAIREPEAFPQFHLDYRERLSDDPNVRWSDRLTLDGTWEGNLFEFYQRVMPRLTSTLKSPFQLDRNLYRFDESSVGAGLREAVVNAIIHADYSGQGGIVFDRYGDRIELSNPGTLLLSREQLLRGGISECRNKSLQLMFQMIGAGDKAGSGLDKIRTSWEDARFRAPRITELQHPDRVFLTLPVVSILPDEQIGRLRTAFGSSFEQLSPEEIQTLAIALDEGEITNNRLQDVLTVHRTDLTKMLKKLVEGGFLTREGIGRWTRYILTGLEPDKLGKVDASHSGSGSRGTFSASEGTPYEVPSANEGTSNDNDGTGTPITEPSRISPEAWKALREYADTHRKQRMPEEQMRTLVCDLVRKAGQLTKGQLADLLQRESENLQARVLAPLVREGRLKLTQQERNHPLQAYATV